MEAIMWVPVAKPVAAAGPGADALCVGWAAAGASRCRDQLVDAPGDAPPPGDRVGLHQGMHVFGVDSPAAFLRTAARFSTAAYSHMVSADSLLLAAAVDHYVPTRQFHQQMAALSGARSVTGHLLTRADHAQDHCHVGNVGLSIDLITDWLEQMARTDLERDRLRDNASPPSRSFPPVSGTTRD